MNPAAQPSRARGRALPWAIIAVSVLLIAAGQHLARTLDDAEPPAEPPPPNPQLLMQGKYAVALNRWLGPATGRQVLGELEAFAGHPADHLRIAMVTAEILGNEAAGRALADLGAGPTLDEATGRDAATLESLYAGGGAAPGDLVDLQQRHGWFGQLAAAFDQPSASVARSAALRESTVLALKLAAITTGVFGLGVAGLVLLVLGIVFLVTGDIRPRGVHPVGTRTNAFLQTTALFLGMMVALFGITLIVYALWEVDMGLTVALALPLALLWLPMAGVSRGSIREGLGWHRGRGVLREIGAGLLGYVAGFPILLLGLIGSLLVGRLTPGDGSHPIMHSLAEAGPLLILLLYAGAVVWAPVFEELLFRGVFYCDLRHRLGFVGAALLVALVFAAIHPQGLMGIPVLTSIAFVFAAIREWRGSLIAPITAHAANNFGAVTIILLLFR